MKEDRRFVPLLQVELGDRSRVEDQFVEIVRTCWNLSNCVGDGDRSRCRFVSSLDPMSREESDGSCRALRCNRVDLEGE